MTMLIVQYPMHRTVFVAVSSLHFHLVEVENADSVHISSEGSSSHRDFANCCPPSSYAGMCDALKRCGPFSPCTLTLQVYSVSCSIQTGLHCHKWVGHGQVFWTLSYFPESLSIAAQSLVARNMKAKPEVPPCHISSLSCFLHHSQNVHTAVQIRIT
jgi:hypothetical protein